METFGKACAIALLSAIMGVTIRKEKDISLMLTIAAGVMVCIAGVSYLVPVLNMLREIEALSQLQSGLLSVLMKCVGVTLATEVISLLCSDAGSGTLSKAVHLLGSASILYLSIPIFNSLLMLIQEILGQL